MSPTSVSLGELEGKTALHSLSEGGNHVIENENDNGHDEEEEEEDDDYTSSSGSSSSSSTSSEDEDKDEDEDDDDEDVNSETIPYIPGRPKPQISLPPNSSDLLSRISSFLPQLQAANADIEQRLAKGESLEDLILDDVKDTEIEDGEGEGGKEYIEMVSIFFLCSDFINRLDVLMMIFGAEFGIRCTQGKEEEETAG